MDLRADTLLITLDKRSYEVVEKVYQTLPILGKNSIKDTEYEVQN